MQKCVVIMGQNKLIPKLAAEVGAVPEAEAACLSYKPPQPERAGALPEMPKVPRRSNPQSRRSTRAIPAQRTPRVQD